MKSIQYSFVFILLLLLSFAGHAANLVVLQTDFGTKDGAVNAMKGVIYKVDQNIIISDLTHEIPPYDIWEASYRLYQTVTYWPKGTIFVTVVDPGVGTARRSIVAKSKTGHYFIGPDNGTLTWIEEKLGLEEVREIDVNKHRLSGSLQSYTFFGRDVYAYTAAKLAAGKITFQEVGNPIIFPLIRLPHNKVTIGKNQLIGTIVALDRQYGNVWTDIDGDTLTQFGVAPDKKYKTTIYNDGIVVYDEMLSFHRTFGEVLKGQDLLYVNSLLNLSISTNQGDFSEKYQVGSGNHWTVKIVKI